MLYKLSFPNKSSFSLVIKEFKDEEGNLPFQIVMQRYFPIPEIKDEEGNIIQEAGMETTYSVDIHSTVEIPKFDKYLIEGKGKYKHNVMGYSQTVKTK